MNPEEGELRPQLLDRFGLCVEVRGMAEPEQRMAVMTRRMDFERDPVEFCERWQEKDRTLAESVMTARRLLSDVQADEACMRAVVEQAIAAQVDGHRADIVMLKTAKTSWPWMGAGKSGWRTCTKRPLWSFRTGCAANL
mgnify:CR=1 FL=1